MRQKGTLPGPPPGHGSVIGVGVPNAERIAATVAMALCFLPQRLIGAEVRFIRRVLGKSSQELAAIVDLDPSTLSRWENDKQEVATRTEKALRMAAVLLLIDRAPGARIDPPEVVTLKLLERKPGSAPLITVQAHTHMRPRQSPQTLTRPLCWNPPEAYSPAD